MKRISQNSVLTILVLISFCFARADVNDDIATIKKLENAFAVALLKNDIKFLEKNLAPEWTYDDESGTSTKEHTLDQIKSGSQKFKLNELSSLKVNVFGDSASAKCITNQICTWDGRDTSGKYSNLDMLVRRNGSWVIVSSQSSKLPTIDAQALKKHLLAQLEPTYSALQNKQVAPIVALFTEDATWILPDASTFKGHKEITDGAKAFFDSYESFKPGSLIIDKIIVINDSEALTLSRGFSTMVIKGKTENHINPFVDHWVKGTDGVWLVAYEINADGIKN